MTYRDDRDATLARADALQVDLTRAEAERDRLKAEVEKLESERVATHQPWWAARAHLMSMAGAHAGAAACYGRALALTVEPRLRAWIEQRLLAETAAQAA